MLYFADYGKQTVAVLQFIYKDYPCTGGVLRAVILFDGKPELVDAYQLRFKRWPSHITP